MGAYQNIQSNKPFNPEDDVLVIRTIDMHTGGEPLRVITQGFPLLQGNSVLEYRSYCQQHFDHLRTALMSEPRGHADMYGCLLTPPNDQEGDFGVVFMHNEGYSTMCGHAIIALTTLSIEMEWVKAREGENIIKIDAPCGRIRAFARIENDELRGVRFHNVPSFVLGLDKTIQVQGLGKVTYDLAFGGAFYAYVDLSKNSFDFDLHKNNYRKLLQTGMSIKRAVMENDPAINHPFEQELGFLYGVIFIDKSEKVGIHSRNVCVFADGQIDRCPTGSGISGRMAIHRMRNEIGIDEPIRIESITGSVFEGSIVEEVDYGPFKAVIPQVEGTANITGMHTFVIDPKDNMKYGFRLG